MARAADRAAKSRQIAARGTSMIGRVGRPPIESATSRTAHPAGHTRSADRATSRTVLLAGRTRSAARGTSRSGHPAGRTRIVALAAADRQAAAAVVSARAAHPDLANYRIRRAVYR